jgi:hypothetical protein
VLPRKKDYGTGVQIIMEQLKRTQNSNIGNPLGANNKESGRAKLLTCFLC